MEKNRSRYVLILRMQQVQDHTSESTSKRSWRGQIQDTYSDWKYSFQCVEQMVAVLEAWLASQESLAELPKKSKKTGLR